MSLLYLIAHIDGACVAIESDKIESIVNVPDVVNIPMSDPSIAGLFALRSRVLTLIDTQYLVTGHPQAVRKGSLAVVAEVAGHLYGLMVDAVDDVVSISEESFETNVKPSKSWADLITATASVDGRLVLLLDPARLVNGREILAA